MGRDAVNLIGGNSKYRCTGEVMRQTETEYLAYAPNG